ncbi:MAG: hypothetical protein L0Z70_03830 [Chloroflexi bacterium]|nr:hypothetical protein [Chloroflexota bacterium]
MKIFSMRLFYGLLFALPLMVCTYALASAADQPAVEVQQSDDGELYCPECHQAFQEAWQNGSHGLASSDAAFLEAWNARDQPGECLECHVTGYDAETNTWLHDGITCEVCHSPYTTGHPLAPMSMERSSALCGECHTQAYFEWQVSAHREEGVECVTCHDPHATDLKAADPALVCAACHEDRAGNFAHTAHSKEGLFCQDCHLHPLDQAAGDGKAKQDHSFLVSLETCNGCHEYEMHDPGAVHLEETAEPDAMVAVEASLVSTEPEPVSPVGFAVLAGLIGIAFGVILAPWFDKFNRRLQLPVDKKESK